MRLKQLDTNTWARISVEAGDLADEIMEDDDSSDYPSGLIAAEVYELLNRASVLAMFVGTAPGLTRDELSRMGNEALR